MLSRLIANFSDPWYWASLLISLPVILFSLTFHEAAHAYSAYKLGDPTAKNIGRLTLNPLKHLDPIGTLCMILFRFGYAKPVPINARNFKKPKLGMALSAFAGPVSNLLLAAIGAVLYALSREFVYRTNLVETNNALASLIVMFFMYLFIFNIYLAVFNLLPIPPLDGSRLAFIFLPDKWYWGIMKYERYIMMAMFILLFTGILTIPLNYISGYIIDLFELPFRNIPFFEHFISAA